MLKTGTTYSDALPDLRAGADITEGVGGAASNAGSKAGASYKITDFAGNWDILLQSLNWAGGDHRQGCKSKDAKDGGLHFENFEVLGVLKKRRLNSECRCWILMLCCFAAMLKMVKILFKGNKRSLYSRPRALSLFNPV